MSINLDFFQFLVQRAIRRIDTFFFKVLFLNSFLDKRFDASKFRANINGIPNYHVGSTVPVTKKNKKKTKKKTVPVMCFPMQIIRSSLIFQFSFNSKKYIHNNSMLSITGHV